MQNGSPCPEASTLILFATGELSDFDAELLTEHVQSCAVCLNRLRDIPNDNDLIESIKVGCSLAVEDPLDREVVSLLIARLRGLSREAVQSESNSSNETNWSNEPQDSKLQSLWIHSILAKAEGIFTPFQLGQYSITKRIGVGGMGIVFEAHDPSLDRVVAIKMIHPRMVDTEWNRRRFLSEARAIATLEHDCIVPVYFVGEERGVPYLVMPLLRGETLESRIQRDGELPIEEVLQIGIQIALGMAAAHTENIVHRDIKPANIWLEEPSIANQSMGLIQRVKILDFGLAYEEEKDSQMLISGGLAGTPAFMPPEQAMGNHVDSRSDLFSLGCVLYTMCAGRLPFHGRNSIATMLSVLENKPIPLSQCRSSIPPQLENLITRLLNKDPELRPQSAVEVATILRKIENDFDNGMPKHRLTGAMRSNNGWGYRAIALLLLTIMFWSLSGVIFRVQTPQGTIVLEMDKETAEGAEVLVDGLRTLTVRLKKEKEPIEIKAKPGVHRLSVARGGLEVFTQEFTMMDGERQTIKVHLEPSLPLGNAIDSPTTTALPGLVGSPASREGFRRWQIETKFPRGEIKVLAWDQMGQRIACGSLNGFVRIFDATSLNLLHMYHAHSGPVKAMDWRPNSDLIATTGEDGDVRIYDTTRGHSRSIHAHHNNLKSIGFSPSGERIASAGLENSIQIRTATGEERQILNAHASPVEWMAWNASSNRLASSSEEGCLRIWDVDQGTSIEVPPSDAKITGIAWNPKGDLLALAESTGSVRVLTQDGRLHAEQKGHSDPLTAISWSSRNQLATGDQAGYVRLWTNDLTVAKNLNFSPGRIDGLQWTEDGSKLAVASNEKIRILNNQGDTTNAISSQTAPVRAVAWSRNGILASAGDDSTVRIWDSNGSQKSIHRGHTSKVFSVSWDREETRVVSGGWDQRVHIWDLSTGHAEIQNGHDPVAWNPAQAELLWGQYKNIAIGSEGKSPIVLSSHSEVILGLAWNGNGTKFASSDGSGVLKIWSRDGSEVASIQSETGVASLKWHPTLPLLASGSLWSGNIQLWNNDGRLHSILRPTNIGITSMAWSPDGTRIASTSIDYSLRILNIMDGSEVASLTSLQSNATAVDWTVVGDRIATSHLDGTIRFWGGSDMKPMGVCLLFQDGNWSSLNSSGEIVASEDSILDDRLVGIVEDSQGLFQLVNVRSLLKSR